MGPVDITLPAEPAAVPEARRALAALQPSLPEATWLDLRLLVSEVVTNAVRHTGAATGAELRLVATQQDGVVRVEVHDEGAGFAAPAEPQPRAAGTSGWGLFLVQKLSRSWGTAPEPDAHVWFELELNGHH